MQERQAWFIHSVPTFPHSVDPAYEEATITHNLKPGRIADYSRLVYRDTVHLSWPLRCDGIWDLFHALGETILQWAHIEHLMTLGSKASTLLAPMNRCFPNKQNKY